ncbi:hypothetical protein ElyMa_002206300 [Elysia marginata]|uniref:Uncharacterized protein n=1 Tax=Elysia marginata TaxID=1093978 RepID=A0AAV4FS86_9GAST|nr:hypothetical protein ElyMa_002206300 [Elysia marginata]
MPRVSLSLMPTSPPRQCQAPVTIVSTHQHSQRDSSDCSVMVKYFVSFVYHRGWFCTNLQPGLWPSSTHMYTCIGELIWLPLQLDNHSHQQLQVKPAV